jgi:hypothetical protein
MTMEQPEGVMSRFLLGVLLAVGVPSGLADAQPTIYVPHGRAIVALPAPGGLPNLDALSSAEGVLVRIDGLPSGAVLAVDGGALGGAKDVVGRWIALPAGPHLLDVALPGGGAIRITVVTPAASSGYEVVPRP